MLTQYHRAPEPSKAINDIENDFYSTESKMARSKIKDSAITLPERPAFGTQGTKVKLWANSFHVNLRANNNLWVYNIEVRKLVRGPEPAGKGKAKKEPSSQPGSGEPERAVKGPQLAAVIAEACRQLRQSNPSIALATELKAKLVATKPVELPNDSMEITMPDGTYILSLEGGRSIDVAQMMRYVGDMKDEDSRCPKFEEAVDALNVVLGHTARTEDGVSVIGSKRFFNTQPDPDGNSPERRILFHGLLGICRGYFQSLRLSTGRLLLNTNVSYGVFRLQGDLATYFTNARIDRHNNDETFKIMASLLSRARVEYRFKTADSNTLLTQRKTITGVFQGGRVADESITVNNDGYIPGPGQVFFQNGTQSISVLQHYRISK